MVMELSKPLMNGKESTRFTKNSDKLTSLKNIKSGRISYYGKDL